MATLKQQLHNSATHATGYDAACPYCIENARMNGTTAQRNTIKGNSLHATLAEVGARGFGTFDGPYGSSIKFYSVNGHTVIVQEYADRANGYEVYGPIDSTNSITATLTAIRDLAK